MLAGVPVDAGSVAALAGMVRVAGAGDLGAVDAEPSAGTALARSDPRRLASER
jgi:hypothetical protein